MILVGTDFSAPALAAVSEARTLAHRLRAAIEVVHVTQNHFEDEWAADEEQRSWLGVARIPEFDVDVRRGTPWVELLRVANEREAQLIVIGTHGRSGFQPLALGSTAHRLALLSPLPTLLVGGRDRGVDEGSRTSSRTGHALPYTDPPNPTATQRMER